ncbi:ABC transporter permease [Sinanaerobacter chloroacetimidivorans]|uniref:ABC transporter permease n=1 Tax=Sinanaerobacter chloroacetimidivorans TaxID=2818044 RepID=A0A8J7VYZ2_9FIRM|nr:ABC transporter permease [Sinanaerobacter chloroacetimidivorans]MBR0597722.1 ABC transporter permease [Sinanaerobacter chloroacetimidivorans]
MRIKAMVLRILNQLRNDKRTLALILCAPLLLLTLIYFILDSSTTDLNVGVINAPQQYVENLYENNIIPIRCSESEAMQMLKDQQIIAAVKMISGKVYIDLDGGNSTKATAALSSMEAAKKAMSSSMERADLKTEINYVYGASDLEMFDNFGSLLIGFLVFFFTFLISGISFLQERTTGTLEKLLSTPIKRWEIVVGYVLGFGIVTVIQSSIIAFFVVYVLDIMMIGSLWLVLLITLLSAMTALTLGMLLSTLAASEFQMIQFIPIVVVPQVFFTGLFDLSPEWAAVGKVMPLYYVADALDKVMIRGSRFSDIVFDVALLLGLTTLFMILNTILLKRYRRI